MIKKSQNRLFLNMSSYAILQVVNLLVGLVLPRLYLAVYGSEVNGVISTIGSFTTYFSYLEAGLGLTLMHTLFSLLAKNNTQETNGVLSYAKKQYQKISYLYFALVVVLSLVFPFLKETNDIGKFEFISLVFVIGAYGALDFYSMAKYRVLLTADRKEYVISNAMIVAQVMRFVFVWLLLRFDLSVVLVKLVPIFTLVVRTIILRIYVAKKYPDFSFSEKVNPNIQASKDRWDALFLQISISTSVSLPMIIVSQLLGYREANVFAVYIMVANAMIAIVSALSSGVAPMLGRSIAQGKDIKNTYDTYSFIVVFVVSIIFSIAAIMMVPFVELYTNVVEDVNYIRPIYAILVCVWAAVYSCRIPVTAVINAAGIYRPNRVHNIINLAIQVVGGVGAALIWGVPGLLVVIIIAAFHRNISLSLVNSKQLLHGGVVKFIIRQVIMVLIIVGSFLLANSTIYALVGGVLDWIKYAVLIALLEILICIVVFVITDFKAVKKILAMLRKK